LATLCIKGLKPPPHLRQQTTQCPVLCSVFVAFDNRQLGYTLLFDRSTYCRKLSEFNFHRLAALGRRVADGVDGP